jgi:hypothetical protein
MLCAYCYSLEHVTEDCHDLLKKWEEKKTNCNIAHVKSCKKKKKNEEVDMWVVTHRGVKTEEDFEHGEGSGQNSDEKIRKEP